MYWHCIIVIQAAPNLPSLKAPSPKIVPEQSNQPAKSSSTETSNPKIVRHPRAYCPTLPLDLANLVFLDENNTIKLGDFGLSRTLSTHEVAFAQTYVGTPYYMSPEIISSLPYTHASDIWALGCVLYELMTHSPPFTAKTQMGLFQKIKDGTFPPLPRDRKTGARLYSVEIEEVVRACLRGNPDLRPSAEDILGCEQVGQVRRQREIDSLHAELRLQHMTLSTRESSVQVREGMLAAREAAVGERETRVAEREALVKEREKWVGEVVERERMLVERAKVAAEREEQLERMGVVQREERLERIEREYVERMDVETPYKNKAGIV